MGRNVMGIDSYDVTVAATATPQNIQASSGDVWNYAKDVILKAVDGNTSAAVFVGDRARQLWPLAKKVAGDFSEEVRLSTILNRMGQSARFDLREIFVKVGTNGDKVHVMLIDPSNDD